MGLEDTIHFLFTVYKESLVANVDEWSNTYEFRWETPPSIGELEVVGYRIANLLEKPIHLQGVRFKRWTVRTWFPELGDYDPTTFMTRPLSFLGTRAGGDIGTPLDLDWCLFVNRVPETGRLGQLWYRGSLGMGDILSTQTLRWTLNPASNIYSQFDNAWTTFYETLLPNDTTSGATLIMRRTFEDIDGGEDMDVLSLLINNVARNKHDHEYFDKLPTDRGAAEATVSPKQAKKRRK